MVHEQSGRGSRREGERERERDLTLDRIRMGDTNSIATDSMLDPALRILLRRMSIGIVPSWPSITRKEQLSQSNQAVTITPRVFTSVWCRGGSRTPHSLSRCWHSSQAERSVMWTMPGLPDCSMRAATLTVSPKQQSVGAKRWPPM